MIMDTSLESVLRIVTLAMIAVSVVLLLFSVRRLRRETRLTWLVPVFGALLPLSATGAYLVIASPPYNAELSAILLAFGFLVGLAQGMMTKVYYKGPMVMAKRSIGALAVWGFAYIATLLLGQVPSAALQAAGVLTSIFGLGIALGANFNLLMRRFSIRQPATA